MVDDDSNQYSCPMPRPRSLTNEDLLDRAIPIFLGKGYAGASLRDLTEATGLSAAALYHRYGDKNGLFRAAIDRYADDMMVPLLERFAAEDDPIAAIAGLLAHLSHVSAQDPHRMGCLLVNSAMDGGPISAEARAQVHARLSQLEAFFRDRLEHARDQGRLPAGIEPPAQAELLLATVLALRTLARLDPDPGRLDRLVADAMSRLHPGGSGTP
ncbi:TetR/AcrR family transcriptional regulator [Acidiphilium sp.]|jgi:TetR/AcrR family transcriptional repressor of nem operon|uniref:Transcriptional regulator, TetR family n=2 Tax=Acidocellaceae TaxID=3385905 RepID=A5G357_ACICJ|nr:TetR/AcrR family transcriptional regulator [Acidiphilium sp.]ABQ32289.1 transcriptional regulator, TetR family [Acidiphilium cryptum JF-5]EGO96851.1 TetR family transcriptional regulator [Acidiphilium sp. PM]KDM68545.1 TetR family transcriptional regulator [Acidiphilium sp. JA12-A1]MBU6355238.1 TetR/AcrR family transcriptional regulator [Rhodospirillales bacterium]UNC14703.1 TetR/AcrR family transcriptional regulator [Acidiphilium multivorum]